MGWLSHKRMDRFFVLRDAYGSVQAKISASSKLQSLLKDIPYESVVRVDGIVVDRGDNRNSKMKTGDIEVNFQKYYFKSGNNENSNREVFDFLILVNFLFELPLT